MNTTRNILLLAACLLALPCVAQVEALPVTSIGGVDYYYYEIQNRDKVATIATKLNVDADEIVEVNPWVANGLEKRQSLFLPVAQRSTASASTQVQNAFGQPTTSKTGATQLYKLAYGDNLYTVAKRHDMTVEGLLQLNPALRPEQYVEGETVKVAPGTALPFAMERTGYRFVLYNVRDGESFYAIAQRNGITTADLQAANPSITRAKKGKNIVIPQPYSTRSMVEMKDVSAAELQRYYAPRIDALYTDLKQSRRNNEVNIGIILPFQLHKETPPRQALLYTDFYKGFLLAVDSVRSSCGKHINLRVYDTQHNLNVTDSILALPQLLQLDMIVAPSEPQQLARINAFGKANGVNVFNCFTTKNEDYRDNAMVYQVNMPTERLAANVIKWFDEQFADYHVIYLEDRGTDEKEIYDAIKSHIASIHQPSQVIKVDGELKFDNLSNAMSPGTKYVFIPSSGEKTLLRNVVKALKQAKDERFDCDMALVGYPEYVLYLKDYQTDLQEIDTYMFSRFFNTKGFRTRDIEARYARWFSGKPLTAVPDMTLFGFDTGMYLLRSLDRDGAIDETTPLHKGIQTSFRFVRDSNWGGYVNDAIDIIHFAPGHTIEKIVR